MSEQRVCHFCKLPIPDGEKAIQAIAKNGWAHFTCWYDGGPFEREMRDRAALLSQSSIPAEHSQEGERHDG